jgi:hypothetical protein
MRTTTRGERIAEFVINMPSILFEDDADLIAREVVVGGLCISPRYL